MTRDEPSRLLDRVSAILDALGDDDRGLGITELAARAHLPKSTVSRLVSGLVRHHYLERDGAAVHLGLRVFELGQLAERPGRLRRAAIPVMTRLHRLTGGTVLLDLRDGADLVCIAAVRGWGADGSAARIGARTALAGSAADGVLLAGAAVTSTMLPPIAGEGRADRPAGIRFAAPVAAHGPVEAVLSLMVPADAHDAEDTVRAAAREAAQRLADLPAGPPAVRARGSG
jgi:DNA-binding IclR family transcriptional regulator